ncbi:MAG: hypothetical protein JSV00_06790 [bacterium]|nr:MAG: hypothetical protein JSV00_06790 [bacterium]
MKRVSLAAPPALFLTLLLLPLLLLAFPSPSLALVEVGAGFGITSFQDDLDGVDTGSGLSAEVNVGSGVTRLMFAIQSSDHDPGDYSAWMVGPSWTLDTGGFSTRIYALISSHEFESIEGWGVTLGGGLGWPILPAASLGFDVRISQWEDGPVDVQTGTLQVLFRIGF